MILQLNCLFRLFVVLLFVLVAPDCRWRLPSMAATPPAGSNLPAESRAVIDTLNSLRELPTGPWKMHVGDLPHGEAWIWTIAPGSWSRSTKGAERGGLVSADNSSAGNAARLRSDRLAHLVPVQCQCQWPDPRDSLLQWSPRGVGRGPRAYRLFDNAHPGDKVVVAVKLLAYGRCQDNSRRHAAH